MLYCDVFGQHKEEIIDKVDKSYDTTPKFLIRLELLNHSFLASEDQIVYS